MVSFDFSKLLILLKLPQLFHISPFYCDVKQATRKKVACHSQYAALEHYRPFFLVLVGMKASFGGMLVSYQGWDLDVSSLLGSILFWGPGLINPYLQRIIADAEYSNVLPVEG